MPDLQVDLVDEPLLDDVAQVVEVDGGVHVGGAGAGRAGARVVARVVQDAVEDLGLVQLLLALDGAQTEKKDA